VDSSAHRSDTGRALAQDRKNRGKIFILDNGKPVLVPVRIGLSSQGFTAIEGNVQEGQAVITGLLSASNSKPGAPTASPFGMQPPGGGGMGRMR
jgi:hypothetical protein